MDTFDNHFSEFSHFYDSRNDIWITSISLSFWGFEWSPKGDTGPFHEGREKAPFPPPNVSLRFNSKSHWWKTIPETAESPQKTLEEGKSSLVLSGDRFGFWWKCSVISPILPDSTMEFCRQITLERLEEFVHQPFCGRCLIFLGFLGAICDSISSRYESILGELAKEIKLDVGPLYMMNPLLFTDPRFCSARSSETWSRLGSGRRCDSTAQVSVVGIGSIASS